LQVHKTDQNGLKIHVIQEENKKISHSFSTGAGDDKTGFSCSALPDTLVCVSTMLSMVYSTKLPLSGNSLTAASLTSMGLTGKPISDQIIKILAGGRIQIMLDTGSLAVLTFKVSQKIFAETSLRRDESSQRQVFAEASLRRGESSQRRVFAEASLRRGESSQRRVFAAASLRRGESSQRRVFAEASLRRGESSQRRVFKEASFCIESLCRGVFEGRGKSSHTGSSQVSLFKIFLFIFRTESFLRSIQSKVNLRPRDFMLPAV
jgi:hypothetical protein